MLKFLLYIIVLYFVHFRNCFADILDCVEEEGFECEEESNKVISCSEICNGNADCKYGSDEGMLNNIRNPCIDVSCPDGDFKCNYGACIPLENRCNEEKNCADGSDEWSFFCNPKLSNPKRTACSSLGSSSKYILDEYFCNGIADCNNMSDENKDMCKHWICDIRTEVRCAYGACIGKDKLCDGKDDCLDGSDEQQCTTKARPDDSSGCEIDWDPNYDIINEITMAHMRPGDRVSPNKRIIINCMNKFFFADRSINKLGLCTAFGWDSPLPKCVKYCDADVLYLSNSTTVICTLDSSPIDCINILPGTFVEIHCANSYKRNVKIREEHYSMTCLDSAKWNRNKMNCVPVCGESLSSTNRLASEAPWHVGVKTYLNGKCGGTILSAKNVITALHCVEDEDRYVLNETQVFVVAGGDFINGNSQIIIKNVSKIYAADNSAIDVAVLELSEPFILSMNARPICMGRRGDVTTTKKRAFVHGWPKNDDHIGDIFIKTKLIKFNTDSCHADSAKGEFCVRPLNLTHTLCQGHSGSGVIVQDGYKNYLIGIISYNPARTYECTNQPIAAIDINHIKAWLTNTISMGNEPTSYLVPT